MAHPDRVERMVFIGPLPPRRSDVWERFGEAVASRLGPEERARMSDAHARMITANADGEIRAACREFWEIGMKPRLADPARRGVVKGDLCAADAPAIRHGMAVTNPATMASLGDWDFRQGLARVTAPTLVIHGEAEAIPMDLVEEWTRALPAARLLRVPGAAHFPYAERPEIVWPELLAFLNPNSPRRPEAPGATSSRSPL